ncbi:uncharacterized protein LOC107830893 [Nicotiana tabacum]|uniref:Uncharacterized protein LOC107830893 n=2 Tax=Nicotiana TaxID=4085 RepID=A0A1S4DKY1_TOBAC|nr:PREDICTED: uncharacterized protein LOC104210383 isoform X2 [Nicotiana sylvestris]XP_016514055.1 PREDICTED: uncharacterized protein LOC107830893 [Nicotiana tabacum]
MVSLSFSSFMLVLFFIFPAIKVSIAHTDQAKQTFVMVREAENGFAMELARSHQSVEKVLLNTRRMDGRKMLIERRNMKKVEGSIKTEEDSKNSGNNIGSANPIGNSRKNLHHQDQCDNGESLNMMNKDYSGGPGSGSKPRHKPPINNYQPFHGSNP